MAPIHTRTVDANGGHVKVGIADLAVESGAVTLSTSGLGSCLAIVVHDARADVGGLVHTMVPTAGNSPAQNPAKYTDTGIQRLVDAVTEAGAARSRLTAKYVGGSNMIQLGSTGDSIGDRNVTVASATFDRLEIPVVATDTGGNRGRSIRFHVESGRVTVKRNGTEAEL